MAPSSSMPKRGEVKSNWSELPPELMHSIMLRLDKLEILESVQKVCIAWRRVSKEPSMWQKIDMIYEEYQVVKWYDVDKMCRHVVDRSQGGLVEIKSNFISDDLLTYIAHRAPNLRSLGVEMEKPVTKSFAKFPLLEELEVQCSWPKLNLKAIGHSCPKLKIFKLICLRRDYFCKRKDYEAIQIAASMPELRHLQLINNSLTDIGLKAILHNCPHLEHLDLRRCRSLLLTGDVEKQCLEKIKEFIPPEESTGDCPFYWELSDVEDEDVGEFEHDEYSFDGDE